MKIYIASILGVVCFFKGHRRGKRVCQTTGTDGKTFLDYQCPRCGATWTRKARRP